MHRKGYVKSGSGAVAAVLPAGDQRREIRVPGEGRVKILVDEPVEAEIEGVLVDVSASGFRASHDHPALSKGQTVKFIHLSASGSARVIWNRITTDAVETGFLVL